MDNPGSYEYKVGPRRSHRTEPRQQELEDELKVVTDRKAHRQKEMEDLIFAWRAVKNTKSNAISLAKDKCLIANGPGQVNRIWPTENCILHGGDAVQGIRYGLRCVLPLRRLCTSRQPTQESPRLSSRAARAETKIRSRSATTTASRWYSPECVISSIRKSQPRHNS